MFFKEILLENNSIAAINEVYIGKTPDLLKAEAQLDVLRKKYMGKYVFNPKVNSDPELIKFDRLMEDCFGFGCFSLYVYNQDVVNCFTSPIDFNFDYINSDKNLVVDKNGFKFNKDADYACILGIYSAILFNPNFTTPEVMAIILHEVGHNFNSMINEQNAVFTGVYMAIVGICCILTTLLTGNLSPVLTVVARTNFYKKAVMKFERNLRENNSVIIAISDYMDEFMSLFKVGLGAVNDVIRIITLGTSTLIRTPLILASKLINKLKNPISYLDQRVRYGTEESADNFATIYGYGPELTSAFTKIGGTEGEDASIIWKNFNKIPLLPAIIHFNEIPLVVVANIFDEHPNVISRMYDQIDLLENELKKNDLDPKMRKCIEKDIEACREAVKVTTDIRLSIDDPYISMKFYNKFLELTRGLAVKKFLFGTRNKFDEYDKVFNKNINK